jgi:hypothetical protein
MLYTLVAEQLKAKPNKSRSPLQPSVSQSPLQVSVTQINTTKNKPPVKDLQNIIIKPMSGPRSTPKTPLFMEKRNKNRMGQWTPLMSQRGVGFREDEVSGAFDSPCIGKMVDGMGMGLDGQDDDFLLGELHIL